MAKRNPNDRNERALSERKKKSVPSTFTTLDGRVIKLKDEPSLIFIQQVIHDVKMPETPTYEVQIGTRTKSYPLDAEVIKQTEDPLEKARLRRLWLQYQSDLTDASMELTVRSTGAVFYEGTVPDEDMIEADDKWAKKVKISGWTIPEDLEERWVFYLQTSLKESDTKDLSAAVVRKTGGASEEDIAAAEELFRDNVQADDATGDLEDAGADTQGTA